MELSVELEPPKGILYHKTERKTTVEEEIGAYKDHVNLISITNRQVFSMSAITMAKRVNGIVADYSNDIGVCVHLTTRLSYHDTYRAVVDAHRIGLSDIMPILGHPRGPIHNSFFKNGFELIGFTSYLKTGDVSKLSDELTDLLEKGEFVDPIEDASFKIGTVIDLNPVIALKNGKTIEIREKQLKYARSKERRGAEYLISQGIFDAQYYFDFIDNVEANIEIIPGIMPARLSLIDMFGLPIQTLDKQRLRSQFTTMEEREEGNKIARRVFEELEDGGCKKIHIYSLGNYKNFQDIAGIPAEG